METTKSFSFRREDLPTSLPEDRGTHPPRITEGSVNPSARSRSSPRPGLSDHIEFDEAPPLDQSREGQRSEIQAPVASVDDQLGDAASHGRRPLETVSAEPVREEDVRERRMRPNDAVVVDDVHFIISGPAPD